MKTRTFQVAVVETPTTIYTKCKATLTDTELTVMDRRGKTITVVPAGPDGPTESTYQNRPAYRYGDVYVRNLVGACGCGGMRTTEKRKAAI